MTCITLIDFSHSGFGRQVPEPTRRYFMKVAPLTLRPDDLLDTAIQEIAQGGFRHIPITDKDNIPLGMLSVRNIISYLVEHFPQEVLTLPPKPVRKGTQSREGA